MKTVGIRKWLAFGAVIVAVFSAGLDATILSIALPTLAHSLNASEANLQWFTSGYLLAMAVAMLPAGLLGDRVGRKKILTAALLLFGAGSIGCAFATSAEWFIAARILLGIASAGIIVMAVSALTVLFSPEERPRAVGIWGVANFLSLPIGPILGGWILTHFWWGWVFLLNVPVSLLGFIAVVILVPETKSQNKPGLDPAGIITSAIGLAAITYGLIRAGQFGWSDSSSLLFIAAGAIIAIGFYSWELWLTKRGLKPIIDITLFHSANFTWGVLLLAILVLAMTGVLFTLPQYFQGVSGMDPMTTGYQLLPLVGGLIVGSVPAPYLTRLITAKLSASFGFLLLAIGALFGAATQIHSASIYIAGWTALIGVGLGITLTTTVSAALSELSEERSGVGAAVMQSLQKIGGPFGAAILGSALNNGYLNHLQLNGLPKAIADLVRQSLFGGIEAAAITHSPSLLIMAQNAFVQGMDFALDITGAIALAGVLLALIFLPAQKTFVKSAAQ